MQRITSASGRSFAADGDEENTVDSAVGCELSSQAYGSEKSKLSRHGDELEREMVKARTRPVSSLNRKSRLTSRSATLSTLTADQYYDMDVPSTVSVRDGDSKRSTASTKVKSQLRRSMTLPDSKQFPGARLYSAERWKDENTDQHEKVWRHRPSGILVQAAERKDAKMLDVSLRPKHLFGKFAKQDSEQEVLIGEGKGYRLTRTPQRHRMIINPDEFFDTPPKEDNSAVLNHVKELEDRCAEITQELKKAHALAVHWKKTHEEKMRIHKIEVQSLRNSIARREHQFEIDQAKAVRVAIAGSVTREKQMQDQFDVAMDRQKAYAGQERVKFQVAVTEMKTELRHAQNDFDNSLKEALDAKETEFFYSKKRAVFEAELRATQHAEQLAAKDRRQMVADHLEAVEVIHKKHMEELSMLSSLYDEIKSLNEKLKFAGEEEERLKMEIQARDLQLQDLCGQKEFLEGTLEKKISKMTAFKLIYDTDLQKAQDRYDRNMTTVRGEVLDLRKRFIAMADKTSSLEAEKEMRRIAPLRDVPEPDSPCHTPRDRNMLPSIRRLRRCRSLPSLTPGPQRTSIMDLNESQLLFIYRWFQKVDARHRLLLVDSTDSGHMGEVLGRYMEDEVERKRTALKLDPQF